MTHALTQCRSRVSPQCARNDGPICKICAKHPSVSDEDVEDFKRQWNADVYAGDITTQPYCERHGCWFLVSKISQRDGYRTCTPFIKDGYCGNQGPWEDSESKSSGSAHAGPNLAPPPPPPAAAAVHCVGQDNALHARLLQLRETVRHFEQEIAELIDAVVIRCGEEHD